MEKPEDCVGVQIEDSLFDFKDKEQTEVRLTNLSGFSQKLAAGTVLGTVEQVEIVEPLLAADHGEECTTVRPGKGDVQGRVCAISRDARGIETRRHSNVSRDTIKPPAWNRVNGARLI